MSVNQGLIKEDEMIVSLNFKKYSQLSNNLKHLVSSLFGAVDENDVITCTKVEDFQKPDFLIKCNDKTRYVSMKSGKALIVHNETFDSFISFLKEKNISEKTLETIALFPYLLQLRLRLRYLQVFRAQPQQQRRLHGHIQQPAL